MFLGFDLGTSGVKALLIDHTQKVVATSTAPLEVSRAQDGWSEQDPADWLSAAGDAVDQLKRSHRAELSAVKAIGLSGQQHGATILDAADKPLRPAILWNDTRAHEEASALDAIPEFRRTVGSVIFPGFTAPKLVWTAKHEPGVFESAAKVLLPKDYLRLWLTGDHASDMSDASGTGWLDVAQRSWSAMLLEQSGMRLEQMPRLCEGTEVSGRLRHELASRWGMGAVDVAGGGGDNAASAMGIGAVSEGDAFVSLGTSGVIFAANDTFRPKPESAVHTFCHAMPGKWHQMGVILSATDALNWFAGIAGAKPDDLTANLKDLTAPGSVTFLPYLSGERTPINDTAARGAFCGIGHSDDRDAMTRAILEGVAFALRDNLDALAQAGTNPTKLFAVGGGSRSAYWMEMIATILDLPVHLPADGDFGAAFGAARLGMIAAEGSDPATTCTKPQIARTFEPRSDLRDAYFEKFQTFRAFYPALKGIA